MKINSTTIVVIASILIAAGIVGFGIYKIPKNAEDPQLTQFATCLKDRGAVFYGAFWCSHCQSQKALFGKSAKYLPYVECSTPDGQGQLEVCTAKGIQGYPTWTFADGSIEAGELTLDRLSEKTGCVLGQTATSSISATSSSI